MFSETSVPSRNNPPRGVTTQKIIDIHIAVKTSNLTASVSIFIIIVTITTII
jgi:hypothetical protein